MVRALLSLTVLTLVTVSCSGLSCLPGDAGCAQCQASCDVIPVSALPECCEAYSACCPAYSNACKRCEANAGVDSHFPEYCCASFTDCCHMVPGLNFIEGTNVKQGSKIQKKKHSSKSSPKLPRSEPTEPHPEPEPAHPAHPEPEPAHPAPSATEQTNSAAEDSMITQSGGLGNTEAATDERAVTSPPNIRIPSATTGRLLSASNKRVVSPSNNIDDVDTLSSSVVTSAVTSGVSRGRGRNRVAAADTDNAATPVVSAAPAAAPAATRSRSRQTTAAGRRTRPNAAERKMIHVANLDRRGRKTSRGRIIQ